MSSLSCRARLGLVDLGWISLLIKRSGRRRALQGSEEAEESRNPCLVCPIIPGFLCVMNSPRPQTCSAVGGDGVSMTLWAPVYKACVPLHVKGRELLTDARGGYWD